MKKKPRIFKKQTVPIVMMVILCLVPVTGIYAQTVTANVRVNDVLDASASTEGAKCITVVGDNVYAVWSDDRETVSSENPITNLYFSKSTDGGLNFSTDISVYTASEELWNLWPAIAVSPAGVIYIAWNRINDEVLYDIYFTKSIDGGTSFSTPTPITTANTFIFPSIGIFGDNVYIFYADASIYPCADYYLVRSPDAGVSFGSPVKVNDAACVDGIEEFESLTSLVVDESGNIYLAWVDGRRTDGEGDIYFAKSVNEGINSVTVGSNVMVNAITPEPNMADSIQYKPRITVGGTNKVYISFTDKRLGDTWDNNRVYLSVSDNGGTSFLPETLSFDWTCYHHDLAANSSDKLSAVIVTYIEPSWGTWLVESTDGGSNFSVAVALNDVSNEAGENPHIFLNSAGYAYAVWTDYRTASMEVYFARTTIISNNAEILHGNTVSVYPNPANDYFTIDLGMTFKNISLNILNTQGQILFNQENQNRQELILKTDLPPGIYYIRIEADKKITTLKLIQN